MSIRRYVWRAAALAFFVLHGHARPCAAVAEASETAVRSAFVEHVEAGDLDTLRLKQQVSGGPAPNGTTIPPIEIDGRGRAGLVSSGWPSTLVLSGDEVRTLFGLVSRAASSLVPRSEASFLPDSTLGIVTLEVSGKSADFFYLADPEQRAHSGEPMTDDLARALDRLAELRRKISAPDPN